MPEPRSTTDLGAVELAFIKGQQLFDRGDFKSAARTWGDAAALLPGTPEHRANHRALLEKIAMAYDKELRRVPDAMLARGILVVLEAHAQRFHSSYPSEPPIAALDETRRGAQAIVDAIARDEAARRAAIPLKTIAPPSPRPLPPPARERRRLPWKGLAIAGGITLGASAALLTMFVVSASRARAYQQLFNARVCHFGEPDALCAELFERGKAENAPAVAGLATGPLLLGAGVAMIVLAVRKKASPSKLAPMFNPHMVGITWSRNF